MHLCVCPLPDVTAGGLCANKLHFEFCGFPCTTNSCRGCAVYSAMPAPVDRNSEILQKNHPAITDALLARGEPACNNSILLDAPRVSVCVHICVTSAERNAY